MKIEIIGEFIRLGQLIKKLNLTDTGGQTKEFIKNNIIKINNVESKSRSTKIFVGSIVWIDDEVYKIVNKN